MRKTTTQEADMLIPHALSKACIQFEGRITRDLTMPDRDWSKYDAMAKGRYVSERKKPAQAQASNITPFLPALLKRQAQ